MNEARTKAAKDIEIALLQISFTLKLLTYCEDETKALIPLDADLFVELKNSSLRFPPGNFSNREDVIKAASVAVSCAIGASALVLDEAWQIIGYKPDATSEHDVIKLRTLVYMVRCAYAHGISEPKWQAREPYKGKFEFELPSTGAISVDGAQLDGKVLNLDADLGSSGLAGYCKWIEIMTLTKGALEAQNPDLETLS